MLCERKDCTGCFACFNICPKKAIEMKEDSFGNIYPDIDEKKCVKCGLCDKTCPSINKCKYEEIKKCYAMIAKEREVQKQSTSGGAATIFSKYIIEEKNGVVYGAAFKDGIVKHIRVDNIEDLVKLKGSKYVHSYVEDSYRLIKKDLINNFFVLFIGTPCQVAGLKKYLNMEYDNLYILDLICHGVPSQKFLEEEIKINHVDNKFDKIIFRENDQYCFKVIKNGEKILELSNNDSLYCIGFISSLFLRENCYNCIYAKKQRVSDITIGDFWGLNQNSKFYENQKDGVSVLLPTTDKGLFLINACKKYMIVEERNVNEAVDGNAQLRTPTKKNKRREIFEKIYLKLGYAKAIKKALWIKLLKIKIKQNKIIYKIYKKLKG